MADDDVAVGAWLKPAGAEQNSTEKEAVVTAVDMRMRLSSVQVDCEHVGYPNLTLGGRHGDFPLPSGEGYDAGNRQPDRIPIDIGNSA